jgi:hypothetical protein
MRASQVLRLLYPTQLKLLGAEHGASEAVGDDVVGETEGELLGISLTQLQQSQSTRGWLGLQSA